MEQVEKISLLLVDDNLAFVSTVRNFLAHVSGVQVVGQAHSGLHALALAADLKPDLVLMDIAMPGMNGLETVRAMNAFSSPPNVIFLSLDDSPSYRAAARDLGARGFVEKCNLVEELAPLIEALAADLSLQRTGIAVVPHEIY